MTVSWGHGDIADAETAIDPLDPQRIAISPSAVQLDVGDALQLAAVAYYRDGSSRVVTVLGRWTVADNTVASIGERGGRVTGLAFGETVARFSYGNASARATVVVHLPTPSNSDDGWYYLVGEA